MGAHYNRINRHTPLYMNELLIRNLDNNDLHSHHGLTNTALPQVARNSFQHLYFDGLFNHSLSLDATIMASKNCPIINVANIRKFHCAVFEL